MPKAWDITTGSPNIKVAVIGAGADYNHEDLINQLNTDYKGWNYKTNNEDPIMADKHETRCAGIIGASTNNNKGVSGIAGGWNGGGIKMMYFQCVEEFETDPSSENVADAINRARIYGEARVISISLSYPPGLKIFDDPINNAWNNHIVVCASAGNYVRKTKLDEQFPTVSSPATRNLCKT